VAPGVIVAADQLTKYTSVEPFLNTSASYLVVLTAGMALIVVLVFYIVAFRALRLPFLLLAGGGASNIYDYIVWGAIRDPLKIGSIYFNIADISIVAGIALLLYFSYLKRVY